MSSASSLYDLAPVLRLMLLAAVIALGPLAWVWLRNRRASATRRLAALTLFTLFLTFDLVLFGAFTRLTDSGLGCPDWPGCYGSVSPMGAHADISAAQAASPTGPVTHQKAWIEMTHRYLAMAVGVLILTLTMATWLTRERKLGSVPVRPWWPTLTLVWVCVQGAFGAWTVTLKLMPLIVTLHLLGGMVLLALLTAQAVRYDLAWHETSRIDLTWGTRRLLQAALATLWLQIALGGWVSTNYAVLACSDFPMCQQSWWPSMDFANGFTLWRPLGHTASGEVIGFGALTAIHYTHRWFAFVVLGLLVLLALKLNRVSALRNQGRWIMALAIWQLASGLANVVFNWPLAAALAHTGGAAGLVVALTWTHARSRHVADAVSASKFNASRLDASGWPT